MSVDTKINYVELTGNLASDARVTDKATFITIATYNGKDENNQERPASFIEVVSFDPKTKELKKGNRVVIKARLANYKDKSNNNYTKVGVVALSVRLIEKSLVKPEPISDLQKDIPWELDL